MMGVNQKPIEDVEGCCLSTWKRTVFTFTTESGSVSVLRVGVTAGSVGCICPEFTVCPTDQQPSWWEQQPTDGRTDGWTANHSQAHRNRPRPFRFALSKQKHVLWVSVKWSNSRSRTAGEDLVLYAFASRHDPGTTINACLYFRSRLLQFCHEHSVDRGQSFILEVLLVLCSTEVDNDQMRIEPLSLFSWCWTIERNRIVFLFKNKRS